MSHMQNWHGVLASAALKCGGFAVERTGKDGHMLYVGGEFRGCVGSIEEGRAYRDELVYDALMAEVA